MTCWLISGCSDTETPDTTFFLSKEWKMVDVFVDGQSLQIDKDQYRLNLNEDLTFTRINFDGSVQEGQWALENGFNQLVLFSDRPDAEQYLIVELRIRKLELQVISSDDKVGSTEYRYLLKPTRP